MIDEFNICRARIDNYRGLACVLLLLLLLTMDFDCTTHKATRSPFGPLEVKNKRRPRMIDENEEGRALFAVMDCGRRSEMFPTHDLQVDRL